MLSASLTLAAIALGAGCGGSAAPHADADDGGGGTSPTGRDAGNTESPLPSAGDASVDAGDANARAPSAGDASVDAGDAESRAPSAGDASVDAGDDASAGADASDDVAAEASVADGGPGSVDAASCSVSGYATAARSAGFAGSSTAYFALFDSVACNAVSDCVPSCTSAGGTTASCTQGLQCVTDLCADGGLDCVMCLPPTYWLDPEGALGQPGSGTTGTPAYDVQAFDNGYNDPLEVTNFPIVLPTGASVRGIAFSIDRSADDVNATDVSVTILKAGVPVGTDHASAAAWPQSYTVATYGGPTDTWGTTWTASDVAAADFGVSITPQYLMSAGNDRVYIDSVAVTVYYGGIAGCP